MGTSNEGASYEDEYGRDDMGDGVDLDESGESGDSGEDSASHLISSLFGMSGCWDVDCRGSEISGS